MPKIGDRIVYSPGFGMDAPVTVTIKLMDETEEPREKYGITRTEVTWVAVAENRVNFILSDGHWCYSEQVDIKASMALVQEGYYDRLCGSICEGIHKFIA